MARKLYPALLTPLTEGGAAVDRDAFPPMVDFLLDHGADGVFVCGTTGEGINLDLGERRQVLRSVKQALGGRGRLLVHCGAQTTRDTVALAGDAAEVGVDGVAVIPPPYFTLADDELAAHLLAAARACAPIPFFIYCFSARSGYPVSIPVIRRVRDEAANLAGLKVSEPSWERVESYMRLDLPVFIGNEPLIAEACEHGDVEGAVSALASVYPEVVRALLDEPSAERAEAVRELRDAISQQQLPATAKALLHRRGVPIRADARLPIRTLTAAEAEAAEERARAALAAAPQRPR
jgi:dihydrodipicolinate synthase/N-acetylneuraminate lyase